MGEIDLGVGEIGRDSGRCGLIWEDLGTQQRLQILEKRNRFAVEEVVVPLDLAKVFRWIAIE